MSSKMQKLKIQDILVQNRKRTLSNLQSLMDSIKEVGLLNPIIVNQDMVLIAGLHRLEACKKLGKTTILAKIIDVNELQAELMEIDENIVRNNLTKLEETEQMARRKEIYEQLHPEATAKAIKQSNLPKRKNCVLGEDEEPKVKTFTKDTADKMGISQRAVQQSLKIANDITPEAKDIIKGTSLENKQTALTKIAKTKPEKQSEVVKELLNNESNKKVKQTKTTVKTNKPVQLSSLDVSYKVDFVKRVVAVNDKWLELPSEYDMEINSYKNMIDVAKNYKNNKDNKTVPLP